MNSSQQKSQNIDPKNVSEKVKYAVLKFRRHRASTEEKKEAVRILADVLEFLRPEIKKLPLRKDEGNYFISQMSSVLVGHKPGQKTEYDQDLLSRMDFLLISVNDKFGDSDNPISSRDLKILYTF